jgi:hypothetical protein
VLFGCVFGEGLPKGSLEPPAFLNGSVPPFAVPQMWLTKAQAAETSSVTLNRNGRASRNGWAAAATGPAVRRSARRRGATRRRGRIMRCSFPGGQGRRHHGCRHSALLGKVLKRTDNWSVKRYRVRTKRVKRRDGARAGAPLSPQGTICVKAKVRSSRYALRTHRGAPHDGRSREVRTWHE